MPMLDMPLKQLENYLGSTPKAADFTAYWERGLAEMRDVNPQVELKKANFQVPFAKCYDLYFTGVRGARIHAKLLRPKEITKPVPALLQFHGYSTNSGQWSEKLNYVAAGFIVAALDCRGQGGLSEDVGGVKGNTHRGQFIRGLDDEPDNMLMRHIFLDAAQLAEIIIGLKEVDEAKVGVSGGSQGGALAIACAGLENRIAKIDAYYPFLSDYKRVWDMDLDTDAYDELRQYFRLFDPLHKREGEIFERLSYVDVQNMAERINGKVQMGITMLDAICPPSTQFAVYNKIKSEKSLSIYYDFGHEYLPEQADMAYEFFLKDWV
jgi:cephalosporin-C deacetylase